MLARGFSSTPEKKFKVLGLQQIAIGALDKTKLQDFWVGHMGLTKIGDFKSERENVDEDILTVGKGILGTIEVDIMAPMDENKSPKVHVPALNHVGLWVDDLEEAVKYLESVDVKIVGGIRKGASGHNVTFIHPKSACGVLVELVQAPKEVIDAANE